MNTTEFKYIISNATYYTKYEPILNVQSEEIYGYEALSKFDVENELISTEEIFRKLHHNTDLFFSLEKRNKELQVKHFDMESKLFLNFDADIVVTPEQQIYWDYFLTTYKKNLVVEITENGNDDESSSQIMQNFSKWLKQRGIHTALDDFGQEGSMFSFFIMNNSEYIKIDKSFLRQISKNKNYVPYLEGVLQTIRLNGQQSIIEGVENKEDYHLVKRLGCDFMQGYYFNDLVVTK